jgi:hypothetical protein
VLGKRSDVHECRPNAPGFVPAAFYRLARRQVVRHSAISGRGGVGVDRRAAEHQAPQLGQASRQAVELGWAALHERLAFLRSAERHCLRIHQDRLDQPGLSRFGTPANATPLSGWQTAI